MHPDTMRAIDFWVGVPLCFLLTLWYKLMRGIGLKKPLYQMPPRKVLVIELAEMGSTVLAYPALKLLGEWYPAVEIHFLTFRQNAATADIIDRIRRENVLTIETQGAWAFARSVVRVLVACRRRSIDTVINLEMFARFSTLLSYGTGARTRVGFHRFLQEGLYTGDFLTHKVPYNPHIHTAQAFIMLVRALGEPQSHVPMGKFPVDDSLLVLPKTPRNGVLAPRAWELLREAAPELIERHRIVFINPNASKLIEVRKWPIENYAELAKRIVEARDDTYVFVVGGEAEVAEGEKIRAHVKNARVLNLAGRTTLPELVALFALGDVLVTNDSGPAHFAALTDIHIMVFFGPETPALYKPLSQNCTVLYSYFSCSPCVSAFNQRRTPCTENMCLKSIEVQGVYQKVAAILSK